MKPGSLVISKREITLSGLKSGVAVHVPAGTYGIVRYESEGAFGVEWLLPEMTVTIEVRDYVLTLLRGPS